MALRIWLIVGMVGGFYAPATVANPGPSDVVPDAVFRTPSHNIYCYLLAGAGGNGAKCVVVSSGDARGRWPYFVVYETGRARVVRSDDFPDAGVVPTLRYGATATALGTHWQRGPVRNEINCTSRTSGLTCRNRSGHGFRLARSGSARF